MRVGIPRVFWACIGMLEAAYLGAICMGLASQAQLHINPGDPTKKRPDSQLSLGPPTASILSLLNCFVSLQLSFCVLILHALPLSAPCSTFCFFFKQPNERLL